MCRWNESDDSLYQDFKCILASQRQIEIQGQSVEKLERAKRLKLPVEMAVINRLKVQGVSNSLYANKSLLIRKGSDYIKMILNANQNILAIYK